jgi:hypothetical protein
MFAWWSPAPEVTSAAFIEAWLDEAWLDSLVLDSLGASVVADDKLHRVA